MSHWDGNNVIKWKARYWIGHSGWLEVDCGCCGGICWGGEEPIECNDCDGRGTLAVHVKSKRIASYPGGPFKGSFTKFEW